MKVFTNLFIRTPQGFTAVQQYGEDSRHKDNYRVFGGSEMLNLAVDDFIGKVLRMTGIGETFWETPKGELLSDGALLDWAEYGVAHAHTIEELMDANPNLGGIFCYVLRFVRDPSGLRPRREFMLETYVKTTEEFSAWAESAVDYCAETAECTPVVHLGLVKLPGKRKAQSGKVYLRNRKGEYLSEIAPDGKSIRYGRTLADATAFSRTELDKLPSDVFTYGLLRDFTMVDVESAKKIFVVRNKNGAYLYKLTTTKYYTSAQEHNAHRYTSKSSAARAAERLDQYTTNLGWYVEELDFEKEEKK